MEQLTESVDATDGTSENDGEPTLFQINVEVVVKDFMSQKVGVPKAAFQVNVDTPEDFLQCVWNMTNSHISRELLYNFESEEYEWANYELNVDSLERFVVFLDKTSKRTTEVSDVTKKTLHAWTKKKALLVILHSYGIVLKKKLDYDRAFKQIIQPDAADRVGAVNNEEVLKNLMRQDSPLLELFKLTRADSEHVQEIRSNISIGKRINKSIADALPMIENEIDDLIEVFKNGLHRSEHLKSVIDALKTQLTNNDNLMDGFNEAVGLIENDFSIELLGDIENIEDIDHHQP